MIQKVSHFVTLLVTAITLVILLVFISKYPDFEDFAKAKDVAVIEKSIDKTLDTRLEGIESVNGLDQLNEKYNAIVQKNNELEASNDELQSQISLLNKEIEEIKKKVNENHPEKPIKEEKPEILKNEVVTVTANHLNFRNDASLSAPIKTTLPKGTKLEVLNKEVVHKDGYKWVVVKLENGEKGYVAREYVQ